MEEEVKTYARFSVCKNPGKLIQMGYLSALAGLISHWESQMSLTNTVFLKVSQLS